MSELYVYVGCKEDTFFFYHYIFDKQQYNTLEYCLDAQIMNCLINETMISDHNKRCVIFTSTDNKLMVTAISHIDGQQIKYNKNNLRKVFIECIKTLNIKDKNEEFLIFQYDYEKKCFKTYEIIFDFKKDLNLLNIIKDEEKIIIDKVEYHTTSKQI